MLEEYGIATNAVAGSGPHGALLKGDILEHIKKAGLTKVPPKGEVYNVKAIVVWYYNHSEIFGQGLVLSETE